MSSMTEKQIDLYHRQLDASLKNGDLNYFYILEQLQTKFNHYLNSDLSQYFDLFATNIFKIGESRDTLINNTNTFLNYGEKLNISKAVLHRTINKVVINSLYKASNIVNEIDRDRFINNIFSVLDNFNINISNDVFNNKYHKNIMELIKNKEEQLKHNKNHMEHIPSTKTMKI